MTQPDPEKVREAIEEVEETERLCGAHGTRKKRSAWGKKIVVVMDAIDRLCEGGKTTTPQEIAIASGYKISARVHNEISRLVEVGYIVKIKWSYSSVEIKRVRGGRQ